MDPRAVKYLTQAWMDLRVAKVIINATDTKTAEIVDTLAKLVHTQIPADQIVNAFMEMAQCPTTKS